jgi:transcriptional regulator GlxA family with amidase domain
VGGRVGRDAGGMRIALVVYQGVIADECEAFRTVLALLEGATVVNAGESLGSVAGPGGSQVVEARFADLSAAGDVQVVVVPGGLGVERTAADQPLLAWLRHVEGTVDYVLASSTGTVVLAAAGLLHGRPAATHWLAGDLLRGYGSERDSARLAVTGNVITAEGSVSAVEAAFALIARIEGRAAADRAREALIERGRPHLRRPSRWKTWWGRWFLGDDSATVASNVAGGDAPVTPRSVMIELVPVEDLAPPGRRRARRGARAMS